MLNLEKSQSINLSKKLTSIKIAAGWDFASGMSIDLDLFAIAYADGASPQIAYFNNKKLFGGAIECGPDNLSGADTNADGIDEFISIALDKLPEGVKKISIFLSSYSGQSFDQIKNEFAYVVDAATGEKIAKTGDVDGKGKTLHFVDLINDDGAFKVKAILEYSPQDFKGFVGAIVG